MAGSSFLHHEVRACLRLRARVCTSPATASTISLTFREASQSQVLHVPPVLINLHDVVATSPSKYPLMRDTFSFFGCSGQSVILSFGSLNLIFLENLHTNTPTPPSFFLVPISRAFLSSHTFNPSLICSFSTLLFLSTSAPATPVPQTISPDFLSYLQHSGGRMLFDTSVEIFGRRSNDRCRRMQTRDQCSLRAATCVLLKYIMAAGGWRLCRVGLRGRKYCTRSWAYFSLSRWRSGSSESVRRRCEV